MFFFIEILLLIELFKDISENISFMSIFLKICLFNVFMSVMSSISFMS